MLALVGLGLSNRGITLEGLDMLRLSDIIYYEDYTNTVKKSVIKELERTVGQKFQKLERSGMEENSKELIEQAKKANVSICISGDPLSATTHISLLLEARRAKLKTAVIHAPSILTAVGETGLQLYKFGRTVTLPKAGSLASIRKFIRKNKSIDLHTLVLLDIGLTANKAIKMLKKGKPGELIVIAKAGSTAQGIYYGKAGELEDMDFGPPPHCLIIPAKTHFVEEEALERWKI